ncbi:glycosyltransferase family 2 protein [Rhizobium sp. CG5]|uniref:glycosyltransferase family 2 protein n=1 Tax=Rhizobium sp. CG5 TaxID=2726076 RepID=UPI0020334EA6|nr:glycosyltransferase [Rhizobium sp. CG5]MCM2473489.1 glycosyltransferase family 2 protein [Rhizobium sp. CG5]
MNEAGPSITPALRIDIGVCTFRRAALEQTLLSLAMIAVPDGASVRIIVADNDITPTAAPLVDTLRPTVPFDIAYVHCPAGNISIARNACLDASTADYLAFIDDDETASEDWLANLLASARSAGAAAVLGPVRAGYDKAAPDWMRRGDFHSTLPVWVGGEIRTGYTCNTLLDLSAPSVRGRRFSLALGKSGGEDTEFFTHVHRSGGLIAYAPEALVHEPVPANRATLAWLAKRRYRMGQTHGRLLCENAGMMARLRQAAVATSKFAVCALASIACVALPVHRTRYALRATLHIGAVAGILGFREIPQYGALGATTP